MEDFVKTVPIAEVAPGSVVLGLGLVDEVRATAEGVTLIGVKPPFGEAAELGPCCPTDSVRVLETPRAQRRKFHVKAPPRGELVGRKVTFAFDPPDWFGFDVVVDVGPLLASKGDPPIWNVAFTSDGAQPWGLGEAFKGTVSVRAADEGEARRRFSEQFGAGFVVTSASRMR